MLGAQVGPYVLERKLGQGGFGAVWVGVHRETGARHALKLIDLVDPDVGARVAREAESLARLDDHPHTVRVHGCFVTDGRAVVVTELVEGAIDLSARLKAGPLPAAEATRLVGEVAAAVVHAHRRGVLHRDLKPANVLLDAAGRARLIDFGLAHLAGAQRLTRTGEVLGTPAALAPEQADARTTDERTDVFGLGALLFWCLTGRPPRSGPNALATLRLAAEEPLPDVRTVQPDVPAPLAELLLVATALDPARRFPTAAAFAAALQAGGVGSRPRPRRAAAALLLAAAVGATGLAAAARARPVDAPSGPAAPGPALVAERLSAVRAALGQLRGAADPAAGVVTLGAALAAVGSASAAPLRSEVLEALLAAAHEAVVRRERWEAPLEARHEREARALAAASEEVAALVGVGPDELAAARLDFLEREEVLRGWSVRLDVALAADTAGLDRTPRPDAPPLAPRALAQVALRLRLFLRAAMWLRDGLHGELERVLRDLARRAEPREVDGVLSPYERRAARLLCGFESYRYYVIDRRPSTELARWGGFKSEIEGWEFLLVQARVRARRVELPGLLGIDPQLLEACPTSRLLALGAMLEALRTPTPAALQAAVAPARIAIAREGVHDDVALGGSEEVRLLDDLGVLQRVADELRRAVVTNGPVPGLVEVADLLEARAGELLVLEPPSVRADLEDEAGRLVAVVPASVAMLLRLLRLPPDRTLALYQSLERRLLRASPRPGSPTEKSLADAWQSMAGALLEVEPPPAERIRELAERALGRTLDPGVQLRAHLVLAQVALLPPADLARADQQLAGAIEAAQRVTDEPPHKVRHWLLRAHDSSGASFGEVYVRLALARGDAATALRRLDELEREVLKMKPRPRSFEALRREAEAARR